MRKSIIILLSILLAGAVTSPTRAQVDNVAEPMGSIYLSASPDEHINVLPDIQPGVPFSFYLVVEIDFADSDEPNANSFNGASAWDAQVTVPADIIVLENFVQPSTAMSLYAGLDYLVAFGVNYLQADTTPFAVVQYLGLIPDDSATLGKGTLSESAFATIPGQIGWVEHSKSNGCTIDGLPARCLRPFATVGDLTFSAARRVPTDSQRWGTLKGDFALE